MSEELKEERERLLELFRAYGILRGDFTLSSGRRSRIYFDGRMLSLHPEGAFLIGRIFWRILSAEGAEAVGGPTLGADPIVAAVALTSYLEGKPMPAFIVRSQAKEHGTRKLIEGHLRKDMKVGVVDDVITTGSSLLKAVEAVEREGAKVVKIVVLLDRKEGGSELLMKRGYSFCSLFTADPAKEGEIVLSPLEIRA